MGKCFSIIIRLLIVSFMVGLCSPQGMGDQKGYDWMGTPVLTDQQSSKVSDYLNPYSAGRPEWDPYGPGSANQQLARPEWDPFGPSWQGYGAYRLQLEPADPVHEGLAIRGDIQLFNQLYFQRGPELLTQGNTRLGESYMLWAKVAKKGSFLLYDNSYVILNQGYVSPGWYKITGAYADFLGQHLYRFVCAGLQSNNLPVLVDSGGYPASLSLTGRVVDQKGQGMPGARVILSNNEGGKFETMTDASGYYTLDMATGIYLVNAESPGYAFVPITVQVWAGGVSAAKPVVGYPAAT
jgi:hypothetical protein